MIAEHAWYPYLAHPSEGSGADPVRQWLTAEAKADHQLKKGPSLSAEMDEAERHLFQRRMEEQLAHWDSVLEDFRVKAKQQGTKMRTELPSQLVALEGMRHGFRVRLDILHGHTGQAWMDLKVGVEAAWQDMRGAVERASSRFK